MVKSLANESALGGWEKMNEPEGSLMIKSDSNNCCYTIRLSGLGAGWYGNFFTMQEILKFVNIQALAIKGADPNTLVKVGVKGRKQILLVFLIITRRSRLKHSKTL